uniref:Putative (-)-alpha-terpineol synthase n=1 Tax=Davidia involucrata TaxID=16924 RepID=A0A5B7B4V6_DAVIN
MACINFLPPTGLRTPLCTSTRQPRSLSLCAPQGRRFPCRAQCTTKPCNQTPFRRSANYQPCIWDYDYVQSLSSDYVRETYKRQSEELKERVKMMLDKEIEPLDQLELIDNLQRLGVSYHFEDEIKRILKSIYNSYNINDNWKKEDLYATALEFRLLRQHGYNVSQEVFECFKDQTGNFKASLCEDTKGMLYLYEASYLLMNDESNLELAREFTTKHLRENLDDMDQNLGILVHHALELPLHWRMLRLEARWFIDVYERRPDMNPILLDLAILDFNIVQTTHQSDLQYTSSWWKSTCLGEKMSFARDRLMESFFWSVGENFEPQYGYCRRMSTKVNALITILDDVYDVYGTLDELELFTDAVERWDINAMEKLPDYMKICFLALYNTINEIAYDALIEQGSHIISYLKKMWADLCKSYLQEAKWYFNGYTPTLEEYVNNALVSVSAPVILIHAYVLVTNPITKEALECFDGDHNIIRWSSIIVRFTDDLGTSSDELKRGDVPKSIECYMHETGASEEDAREHIKFLIRETWKKMNEDRVANSPFSETFTGIAVNLARTSHSMYLHGDGHGVQDRENKDRALSLFVEPIPLM